MPGAKIFCFDGWQALKKAEIWQVGGWWEILTSILQLQANSVEEGQGGKYCRAPQPSIDGILLVCGFALIFALAPISPMFCPQRLPLPLPSILPLCFRAK